MTKLKEELWKTLLELGEADFKEFKWFLKQDDILAGCSGIPLAHLEAADRVRTVDLMVQKYQSREALTLTMMVLKKISRNDLVQGLSETSLKLKDLENHHSVPVKSDYEAKKAELEAKMKLMIKERQMKIQEIEHSVEFSNKSADRHIADSKQVFNVLQLFLKRSLYDLIEAIQEKQKDAQRQADKYIEELEHEICKLRKRSNKMEQPSCTDDDIEFIESFSSGAISSSKTWTEVKIHPPSYGRSVGAAVNRFEEEFSKEKAKLIAKAKLYRVREYAKDVTLDPDTANPHLVLSGDGREVHCGTEKQNLPDNPKRFNTGINVLGKQSFSSGRFYFEVQVKGKTSWDVGVVKETIERKGKVPASPENGYWTICLREEKYEAFAVHLKVKYQPKKVGVFVDYEKGSVSFHDVDSADILHSFTDCSFTEKLYPFFSPGTHHGGKNSTPLIISAVSDIVS